MSKDLKDLFKKVTCFNLVIIVLLVIVTHMVFQSYFFVTLIGLVTAFISFLINGIMTEYTLLKKTYQYKAIAFLGFIFRVLIICIIALVLFKYNKFNVIAFMLGYSLHFISLVLYGLGIEGN